MDLKHLQNFINEFSELPKPPEVEPNLFSVGARGHYENPITDLLAFFFDTNAAHGLESLALEALIMLLPEEQPHDLHLIRPPEREVNTGRGRIDLLLEANNWVMVLENKIFHAQNNPFKDYQVYVKKHYSDKTPLLLVLSPAGTAPKGWQGISYLNLVDALKHKAADAFMNRPMNKWLILLREFILHLEQLMNSTPDLPAPTVEFILNNLHEINQLLEIKTRAINTIQKACVDYLQEAFGGKPITSSINQWHGYPAIRFALDSWQDKQHKQRPKSDVVLYLDACKGQESFHINYYIYGLQNEDQHAVVVSEMKQEDCTRTWRESNDTIACFQATLASTDQNQMFEAVAEKMRLVDRFEDEVRSKWD